MLKQQEKERITQEVSPLETIFRAVPHGAGDGAGVGGLFGRPWHGFKWPERLREIVGRELAVEVYEEKDYAVVKAEIPGMKKEEIEVNITDDLLTMKGEKKKEEEVKEKGYYYSERSYGSFERSVEIPRAVHADKARATFKDGVLEIRLPKTEEAKRKEVKLKVE